MSKTDKARQGKFALGIRGRSAELTALRNLGWSWDMVASHFFNDAALGNANGTRFSQEWSRQRGLGMPVDDQRAAQLTAELLIAGRLEEGRWVFHAGPSTYPKMVEDLPPEAHAATAAKEKPAAPVVVEAPSAPSAPMSQGAAPDVIATETTPIELPQSGMDALEKKLRTGVFKATDFADLLGFPTKVCELAFMEARKEPRDLATVDRLVGRMVFSRLLRNEPGVLEYVGRLPGAARWEKLKATGILAFETAAKMDQQ